MEILNLKLVLIVLLAIIIGGLVGSFITKEISKRETAARRKSLAESFAPLQTDANQLLNDLYDKEQHLFRISKDSPASLEGTYYAVASITPGGVASSYFAELVNVDEMFDKIRSYYTTPGYYLEKDKDPVVTTRMALEIDSHFSQKLDQEIDLNWLKLNSLENENLEESKLDPEYQRNILEIYRFLPGDQKETKTRITPIYLGYYCKHSSGNIADEDYLNYLRKKYHQISIINYLIGEHDISSPRLCLRAIDVKADKERLNKISFSSLTKIKELAWLYYLKGFYSIRAESSKFFGQAIEYFYSDKVFKENLCDKEPNLIGTFYGIRSVKLYSAYNQYIQSSQ